LALPAAAAEQDGSTTLHLVSFGAVHGEITDCGCKGDLKGGLDLRAGIIDSLHEAGADVVHLDAGAFFSTQEFGADEMTRFLWEAMKRTEVDAVTPGTRELSNWPLFEELMADDVISVVSTNLTRVEDGVETPIGQRYVVLERGGIKIGVLGLISGRQYTSVEFPDGVEVRFSDPLAEARKAVHALDGQVDLLVLLSQMSVADTKAIVAQVPEIDVAILGDLPAYNEVPEVVGSTIVQSTGTRGHYLGHLVLTLDPERDLVGHESKNAKMWDPLPRNSEMAEQVKAMLEKIRTMQAEARSALQSGE
jgi:2',3'-cyclic-nucleotide 2'-phosphodiesterase (5'-nucleotidase family)